MAGRQVDFDEETDRILLEISEAYDGDISRALADLIHAHESLERFVGQCEEAHHDELDAQVNRAEEGFRKGRFTPWSEIKVRNGL
jgi:hypothetical protein